MARVPYLDSQDLKPQDRDLLARNINLYRALCHSPGAARKFSGLGSYIRHKSKLDPQKVLYMVPTKAFQIHHYSQRAFIQHILKDCDAKLLVIGNQEQWTNLTQNPHCFDTVSRVVSIEDFDVVDHEGLALAGGVFGDHADEDGQRRAGGEDFLVGMVKDVASLRR